MKRSHMLQQRSHVLQLRPDAANKKQLSRMVFLFESLSHQAIYSTEIKSLVPKDIWIGVFIAVLSILVVKKTRGMAEK